MTPLNANMAATLLGKSEIDLEHAPEGEPGFITHEPSGAGRCFRLDDVWPQAKPGGIGRGRSYEQRRCSVCTCPDGSQLRC